MRSYVWRELVRNPRRTLASLAGVVLGVGLFSGVLLFMDGSSATMTKRALAPLVLDMQRVLTDPLGSGLTLRERLSAPSAMRSGATARVTLTVTNRGRDSANEVVVNDEPPPPLAYVEGTTRRNGRALRDRAGQSPLAQGLARSGLNVGTVRPGETIRITYVARAARAVPRTAALRLRGTLSSREHVVPTPANAPPPLTLEQLRARVTRLPGVAAADGLGFADLPRRSLHAGRSTVPGPVRVFGFDGRYRRHHPSIRVIAGSFPPGSALVSVEAARALRVTPGATIRLRLPGARRAPALRVGGIVDLARATPLFSSRKTSKLEDFIYVPNAVVVSPATFEHRVIPAFRAARASVGRVLKSLPVLELDVAVDRSTLHADPARALSQTKAIAASIDRIAPAEGELIDNISNALAVARDDAAVGKRMFVFLGLPGGLLAAFLAGYAASVLAAAQRRERATLRMRGALPGHLLRMLLYRAVAIAGAGSVLGAGLGFACVLAILGPGALLAAAASDLLVSALTAITAGVLITALVLYVPGRRALRREVSDEGREMRVAPAPAWQRLRLDFVLIAAAAAAEAIAYAAGAFDPPSGSVSAGQAVSLPSRLLLAPVIAWFGGTLLAVRVVVALISRLPERSGAGFGPVIRGALIRSLRRRPWALATGVTGVGLVTALGVSLALFAATYDGAKAADARFVVGSDIRVTPGALSDRPHPPGFASTLLVRGTAATTPVVFKLENSVLFGRYDQDRKDLAAIEPASFARVAPLAGAFFVDGSAEGALARLEADPRGVLVESRTADDLQIETGDRVRVLLARGTRRQTLQSFDVVGVFTRFPGFPQGTDLVANLDRYVAATRSRRTDFFLVRAADRTHAGLSRAVAALRSGPGRGDQLRIDSTETALAKDQTSLTALNVHGLVKLDSLFTLLMSVAAVGIFVFGLLLQRRREYVALRAQGAHTGELLALVLGEAGLVAVCGVAAGLVVGTGMGFPLVHVLRPLFIVDPIVRIPVGDLLRLGALVLGAALAAALSAVAVLRRLAPAEVLREE